MVMNSGYGTSARYSTPTGLAAAETLSAERIPANDRTRMRPMSRMLRYVVMFVAPAGHRLFAVFSRSETNGVEVRIMHDETQPDGLARELADVRAALPRDDALDLVAPELDAVLEGKAGYRLAGTVLDLDL